MDWGRAKTILILSFICLNGLLAYQLWFHKLDFPSFLSPSSNLSSNTKQALLDNGIRLDVDIPKVTPKVQEITIHLQDPDDSQEIVRLETKVSTSAVHIKSEWREKIASQIEHAEDYTYDPILSNANQFVWNQMVEGVPIFEVNLILHHDDQFIYGYEQRYVAVSGVDNIPDQNVLPADRAVEFLANNILHEGSVIKDIRLGYHGQKYDSDIQYFAPKWRVALQDGNVYYIHAINGEVESAKKELSE